MKQTNRKLRNFFLISFAWMWGLNLPRVLAHFGLLSLHPLLHMLLGYFAVFAPGIAAFCLTKGKENRKTLWKRGWQFKAPGKWWIPTMLIFPLSGGLTVLIMTLMGQTIAWEYSLPPAMIVPISLLIWLLGAYPEEFGWRGYAQERLEKKFSPLLTSLILGAIWAIWHLPLHFVEGSTQSTIPVAEFFIQTVVLTILYTWLYHRTQGNVAIAAAFHAMGNITGALIPFWVSSWGRWISFGILMIVAVVVVVVEFPKMDADRSQQSASSHKEKRKLS